MVKASVADGLETGLLRTCFQHPLSLHRLLLQSADCACDSSRTETDRIGTTHMYMHFHATGAQATGVVNVHMTRKKDESEFQYHLLALDVPGHERIWLENAEKGKLDKRNAGKMFGVRWW